MARRRAITIQAHDRFVSDTHFGHASMLTKAARPWHSVEEMDTAMIAAWNGVVRKNDVVYFLGDFCHWRLPKERMQAIFDRLNGCKRIVMGNHDTDDIASLGWDLVVYGTLHLKDPVTGLKIDCSHHPKREWDGWWNGGLHLHGHVHGNLPDSRRSLDLSVDNVGFHPLTIAEIHAKLALLPELDFRGVPVADFVPGRDDAEEVGAKP